MGMRHIGAGALLALAACSGNHAEPQPGATPSAGSYCEASHSYLDQFAAQNDRTDTPESVRQIYQAAAHDIHAALAVAPAEIRADVKTVADGVDQLIAVLEKYGYDGKRLATAPDELPALDSPKFDAALQRVDEYTERTCR